MNGNYLNKLLKLEAKHSLYREDGKWYHNLKKFPGALFDKNGYVVFRSKDDYLTHSSLQHKKDLHVINGIESFKQYQRFTKFEKALIEGIEIALLKSNTSNEESIRILREIDIILRKRSLVDQLKKLYQNTCQLCGIRLPIGKDVFYSEVHHIVPLGHPHNGIDNMSNMICVCPNCHVRLDLMSIKIEIHNFSQLKHEISSKFIEYYNHLVI